MAYDLSFDILWQTRKYIPFLGREVQVEFISKEDRQAPTQRQIALLDSLDTFSSEIVAQLADWAREDYRKRLEDWGMTPEDLQEQTGVEIDESNIQSHFQIEQVVIPRIRDCAIHYVFLCGECDWDEEHGIEFLLKNGTPIRCGAQEGLALNAEWKKYLAGCGKET